MNQDQKELTLEESIKEVMQTLPPVIRNYLAQGKYTVVAQNLMAKYGLRIDQGGVLEREIMLLLMGIENPEEFTQALATEARLDEKTIGGIVQDINTQIFVPLREEEMSAGGGSAFGGKSGTGNAQPAAAQPPRPMGVGVPNYAPPRPPAQANPAAVLPSRGNYAPPPQSPRYPNQDNINAFVRRVPPIPVNSGRPSVSVITPPTPPTPALTQVPSTPAETPLRQALRAVVPPTSLPGAPRPSEASSGGGMPPSDLMPPAPIAPYSSDPYRESFDEK